MLAVAPSRNTTKDHEGIDSADIQFGSCSGFTINPEEFPEFSDHGSLLESIDFDDLFDDGDILPDLEIDPDIFTDFSGSSSTSDNNNNNNNNNIVDVDAAYGADIDEKSVLEKGDEVVSKREDNGTKRESGEKKRKCSSSSGKAKNNKDNNQGKRKVKVDWTPELHRRFVQAVEQLGVDKAVPSRILELMGVHCLTRHNVASHLQKYRSHRKHLLAREAEAASWTRKRQMYGAAPVAEGGGKNGRGSGGGGSGLIAPTIGFPQPMMPPPMMHHHHRPHYGPLHVWGHPTVDQSLMQNMWPKHLAHTGSPPPPSPAYPPMWVPPSAMWVPSISTPGSPCFAQPIAAPTTRFGAPPVPGFPPPPHHGKYKAAAPVGLHPGKSGPPPPADFYPSKESIDAAIGDALTKPWLPFPLGLKPPAVDSVMVELHRHGVSMVPPADENAKKDKKEKN